MLDEMLYKYGMFSEYIPSCFNSYSLYEQIDKLRTSYTKSNCSECVELSIYKTDITRRIIKVPNPEQYVFLCEKIKKYIDEIQHTICLNENTESNPFRENKNGKFLDIPLYCQIKGINTNFWETVKKRMLYSMGYKYQLKLDLSKFYDSIYTHIMEWCISGEKKKAKRNWGSDLDYALRATQLKQTKGIPTGPFTSRIISEFILTTIDNELRDAGFKFKHYVDDYRFYFKTKDDAISGLKEIANIFSGYKLELNDSKTEITEYPYDTRVNLNHVLYNAKKINETEKIIYVIGECNRLYKNGEAASYKYVLKSFKNLEKGDLEQWLYLESFFLSVLTIKPDLVRYISTIVIEHKNLVSFRFIKILKEILKSNIEDKNECEVLWIFWLLLKLDALKIIEDNIIIFQDVLSLENDLILIMVIDYIKENNVKNDKIDALLKCKETYIASLELKGSHWLLLYEAIIKKWFKNDNITKKIQNNNFFKVMKKNKVDFYNSI